MPIVEISLKQEVNNSYDIVIDSGTIGLMASDLKNKPLGNKYAIITDDITKKLYGNKLLSNLKKSGINSVLVSFKAGEQNKNLKTFEFLHDSLLRNGFDRKSCIIALGGGIVGDVAGFAAATFMRGINYVQAPTTLLAQVDSSIGGKTAVDLKGGKNAVGSFYQPKKVYIDIDFLKTLPKRELINGLTEIIKHAVIADGEYFSFLEDNIDRILALDREVLIETIRKSCEIKAWVIEEDIYEGNLRKSVNYGHTIGHAIETLTNYKKFAHGEAIAIGMAVEGRISNLMGWMKNSELARQNDLLRNIGFKLNIPKINVNLIIKELSKDKKAVSGKVYFSLPECLGKMKEIDGSYGINVPIDKIRKALSDFL